MESAPSYKHKPLSSEDSIRVFELLPAINRLARVKVELKEVSLSNMKVDYEAVSYVWGKAERGDYVICNGQRLPVTDSCYDALVCLRQKIRSRRLWVDAICIDQSASSASTRERNHQVQRMGQVYHSATRVLIWFGISAGLDSLFKFFEDLERQPDLTIKDWALKQDRPIRPSTSRVFAEMMYVGDNPWFCRVWTVQEVAMARAATIVTADLELDWETFAAGVIANEEAFFRERINQSMIDSVKLRWSSAHSVYTGTGPLATGLEGSTERADIENHRSMMRTFASLRCSRDHDRVFGLHAILQAWGYNLPPPDYQRPVSEVLQEFTMAYISLNRSLLPLTIALPPEPSTGLPSWISYWSTSDDVPIDDTFPDSIGRDDTGTFYALKRISIINEGKELEVCQARNVSGNLASRDRSQGSLQVRGKRVGKVHSWIWKGSRHYEFLEACRQWCRKFDVPSINKFITLSPDSQHQHIRFSYPSPINYFALSALGHPFNVFNTETESEAEFLWYFHQLRYPNKDEARAALEHASTVHTSGTVQVESLNYRRLVQIPDRRDDPNFFWCRELEGRYYSQYAFMTLDNGLHARAHHTCQVGDEAWLLAGSDAPILLRRQERGQFRVVAPAYIHGIMLGEMWPEDTSTLETITLV
ncbi:heterokaryon incompatibility protein-domain-containing protein [Apiospora saccharicola]